MLRPPRYPQRALADTEVAVVKRFVEFPAGENAVIAIGSYTGLNQEDAIIFHKAAIERGLFRITVYHTFTEIIRKCAADAEIEATGVLPAEPPADFESFERPDVPNHWGLPCVGLREVNYGLLGIDGLALEGTCINDGDVIIGKTVIKHELDKTGKTVPIRYDASRVYRYPDTAIIDRIQLTTDSDGNTAISVRVRATRTVLEGDKFSSRHGQKGTVGAIFGTEDMPYIANGPMAGVVPDMIVSPEGFPSRMTIGQLLEMAGSRLAAWKACFLNATPFREMPVREFIQGLTKFGDGGEKVQMIDGRTGVPIEEPWNVGIVWFQRLRHMVLDKLRARARGPRAPLTHQPMGGKQHDGGLRFGEMETDALVAHGAASVLEDRLFKCSDEFVERVCVDCGELGQVVEDEVWDHKPKCRLCGSTNLTWMPTNYAWVLLVNELRCLSIRVRHDVEVDGHSDHDHDHDSDHEHEHEHDDHEDEHEGSTSDNETDWAIAPLTDSDSESD